MKKKKTVEQCAKENIQTFMKHGPGLRMDYNRFVVARDRKNKRVLQGGLGGLGIGKMWIKDIECENLPGYNEAPEEDSTGGFGTECLQDVLEQGLKDIAENARKESKLLHKRKPQNGKLWKNWNGSKKVF